MAVASKRDLETFSFTLTLGDGSKRFGYCRRFGSGSTSECFCLISERSSFSLFSVLLDIVEERRKYNNKAVFTFLKSIQAQPPPPAGTLFKVSTFSASGSSDPDSYELEVPLPNEFLLDYVSYRSLFKCLQVEDVVTLFEALLRECRIVFLSKSLGRLSSCGHAATAMLTPFAWQYVFIPVLPASLLDYCSAPMPFIVGVVASAERRMNKQPMEEVLLIDLDKGCIKRRPELVELFPAERRASLTKDLYHIKSASNTTGKWVTLILIASFSI